VSAASKDTLEKARLERIFSLSVRHLLLLLAPAALLLGVFAPDLLRQWLGQSYADRGAAALRILSFGVMINGLSHVPCGYLQASGRPDIPAKFHLIELAIHLPLTLILVRSFGITGAALAWTLRVCLDSALLFVASNRVLGISPLKVMGGRGGRVAGALATLALALLSIGGARLHAAVAGTLAVGVIVAFGSLVWSFVFDEGEREAIRRALTRAVSRSGDAAERTVAR
jgi:O-antigen/teichoic acid export membrane protein